MKIVECKVLAISFSELSYPLQPPAGPELIMHPFINRVNFVACFPNQLIVPCRDRKIRGSCLC